MTTVNDIVTGAMKLLGVVFKSESISSDEATDGLNRLNELIASWSNEGLMVYAKTWENFTLTANDGVYTIGTGADFSTDRPIVITSAYIRESSNDYPLEIITDAQYALEILQKTSTSNIPQYLNYDNAFPNATIRLWPIPSTANVLYLQSEKQFTQFAGTSTDITMPPGWLRALRYNLAVDLAPEYGVALHPSVIEGAKESKGLLKSSVLRNNPIVYSSGLMPRSNIYTGDV